MKLEDNQNTFKEEFKVTKSDLLALPNILCYIRLLLIPLFMVLYIKAETKEEYYSAGFVVLIASLTDFLDGFIARKLNMITDFGKLLDPMADKLMQTALILVLILEIDYMYILALIFIKKEIIMTITAYVFMRKGKKLDGSKWFGKVSTTVFYVTMLILIVLPSLNDYTTYLLMITCGAFLTLSFVLYGREYYIMYRQLKSQK